MLGAESEECLAFKKEGKGFNTQVICSLYIKNVISI